ncbi:MAG: hypothetical protein BAJALOKI3v1_50045 [Promethearchaeota archaeon]|nr:MAG: hypothetical protein BAJALOKI3v1_50045 [Candidatus Lokiarchaeota archaeon]
MKCNKCNRKIRNGEKILFKTVSRIYDGDILINDEFFNNSEICHIGCVEKPIDTKPNNLIENLYNQLRRLGVKTTQAEVRNFIIKSGEREIDKLIVRWFE